MRRLRISLSVLLLSVAIVALGTALFLSRLENRRLNGELETVLPLRGLDIAAHVERVTAEAGVPAEVHSTKFSGKTYLVSFAYFHPDSGDRVDSSFKLRYEGEGRYIGFIRDAAYLKSAPDAQGERGLAVTVVDPDLRSVFPSRSAGEDRAR